MLSAFRSPRAAYFTLFASVCISKKYVQLRARIAYAQYNNIIHLAMFPAGLLFDTFDQRSRPSSLTSLFQTSFQMYHFLFPLVCWRHLFLVLFFLSKANKSIGVLCLLSIQLHLKLHNMPILPLKRCVGCFSSINLPIIPNHNARHSVQSNLLLLQRRSFDVGHQLAKLEGYFRRRSLLDLCPVGKPIVQLYTHVINNLLFSQQ